MSHDVFKHYSHVVWQRLPQLLLVSLIAATLAWFVTSHVPATQEVHFSYLVALADREPSSQYRFDGYYALQATDLFTSTVTAWLTSPEVIVAAYQAADLPLPAADPKVLLQKVTAEKTAPQMIHVIVHDTDPTAAAKLAQGLQVAMQHQLDVYHQQGTPALTFKLVPTTTWTGTGHLDVRLITLTVFIVILFLGINIVVFRESLRGE